MKTPWDFYKSIFKDYKADNAAILDQCFEYDWQNTKCEKIIKGDGEAEKVKAYLKQIYKPIREAYKFHAGINPTGRVSSIGTNTLTEILY